jgi:hypothetical protein
MHMIRTSFLESLAKDEGMRYSLSSRVTACPAMRATFFAEIAGKNRIASQKSSFLRLKYLLSSDSVLVSPPRLHLRSSAQEQERNTVFVREQEEGFS